MTIRSPRLDPVEVRGSTLLPRIDRLDVYYRGFTASLFLTHTYSLLDNLQATRALHFT